MLGENIQSTQELPINGNNKTKFYNVKKIVFFSSLCFIYLFFLLSATFIFFSKKDLTCYKFDDVSVCGRFKLDRNALIEIKDRVKGQPGNYIYGYTKDLGSIKIHRID